MPPVSLILCYDVRKNMPSCPEEEKNMMIRSRTACILWRAALLFFGLFGLLDEAGILTGSYHSNFPHMFTNISNMFAWAYFACALASTAAGRGDGKVFAPFFKYTAMISLLVTMLIGHFMLFDALIQDGKLVLHLVVLHYIVPLMALLDWLLFDEKGKMPLWGPCSWISLALAYLAFSMIGAGLLGLDLGGGTTADITSYPYTFLDPAIAGPAGVAAFCSAMVAAFLLLGYLILGIDRFLSGKKRS